MNIFTPRKRSLKNFFLNEIIMIGMMMASVVNVLHSL